MRIGIIGGTGVYSFKAAAASKPIVVDTAYGDTQVRPAELAGHEVFFLARHGAEHTMAPHRINYRANIAGLRELGCGAILATNAVGSLNEALPPGAFVTPDQFLDFTKQRALTFFDGEDEIGVKHLDVTVPYCPACREWLQAAAEGAGETCGPVATYLCAEGPRFETPAEIRMFKQWGADLVGMTGIPEVVLAREARMCYASLCLVSNMAAGISDSPITHHEVTELMDRRIAALEGVLEAAISRAKDDPSCACRQPII